jgi:hypothetical protein
VTSRRSFLLGFASVTAAGLAHRAAGQTGGQVPSSNNPRFRPVKEFRGAHLHAVSADGSKMCMVLDSDGVQTWTYSEGQWSRENVETLPLDAPLCVVELGSWKTVYSTKLEAAPFMSSFLRDSPELYVTAVAPEVGNAGNQQVVIDLQAGSIKQEQTREGLFQATRGQQLLTAKGELGKGGVLSVVELPEYREVAHADLEVPRSGRSGTSQIVSSHGDVFVYGVDDLVVCRRTDDLGVLWTRRIGATRVWRIAISARGDRIAAVADAAPQRSPRVPPVVQPLFIVVYDGRSGTPIATFSADVTFNEALALSPDGKLLAVAQRVPADDKQNVDLFVDVYEIASNRRIARELHCRVPPGRFQNLNGSFSVSGIQFAPDGRWLITSGYDRTKVWEVLG